MMRHRHTHTLSYLRLASTQIRLSWDNDAASMKFSAVNSAFCHVEMFGGVKVTVVRTPRRHFIAYSSAEYRGDSTWSSHSSRHNYWLWCHCWLV